MHKFLSILQFCLCFAFETKAEQIGTRTLSYISPKSNRILAAEIYYPTSNIKTDPVNPYNVWVRKPFVRNTAIKEGKYPLVIFSHGFQGDRIGNSWIAESLVDAGYVVVMIDHANNNSYENSDEFIYSSMWQRPLDISDLLDSLLKDDTISGVIDADRIAAAGFSLGGTTALWLGGVVADPASFKTAMQPYSRYGIWPDFVLKRVEAVDWSKAGLSYGDSRIKAVFAIAPDLGFGFKQEGIKEANKPVLIIVGDQDQVTPPKKNAQYFAQNLPNKKSFVIKGATHFAFMNKCSDFGRKVLPPNLCTAGSKKQEKTHRQAMDKILEFLKENLG